MSSQTYVITITDGTTTKTLTSSPFGLLEYIPNPPRPDDVDSLDDRATVTETCVIRIIDGSAANNLDEVRTIQRLLDQGRKAQTDVSLARVYVTFKETTGGTEYRSEVVSGMAEYDPDALGYTQWVGDVTKVRLTWERTWYYEATSAVQLEVSNHLVTDNTSGAPVHNPRITAAGTGISFTSGTKTIADSNNGLAYFLSGDTIWVRGSTSNDGAYTVNTGGSAASLTVNESLTTEAAGDSVTIIGALNNYVEVAAAQVGGVVNAPVRLELVTTGDPSGDVSIAYEDLHIGISRMNNISNFGFTLEAEDGSGGTSTAHAEASGGFYKAITWTGNTEKEIWTYALTPTVLAASRGAYFLPVIRLQGGTITTATSLRMNLTLSATTIYEGALITLTASDYLQPLGIVQLPPYMERLTASKALTLSLLGTKSGGGSINLDYVQLIPLDDYRFLRQLGYSVPTANTLFVDELFSKKGLVYSGDSASGFYRSWVERGSKLKVQPNTKQRIYMLHDETDNTSNIGRVFTVKLYYRPRRLNL